MVDNGLLNNNLVQLGFEQIVKPLNLKLYLVIFRPFLLKPMSQMTQSTNS